MDRDCDFLSWETNVLLSQHHSYPPHPTVSSSLLCLPIRRTFSRKIFPRMVNSQDRVIQKSTMAVLFLLGSREFAWEAR